MNVIARVVGAVVLCVAAKLLEEELEHRRFMNELRNTVAVNEMIYGNVKE